MGESRTEEEIKAAERKATAEAEGAEWEAAKKRVEADALDIDVARKRAEFEEWHAGRRQRDKDAAATTLSHELKNAESQRTAIKDLVPDLSGVERGSTTVPDESTVFHALLGGRALQDAARKLISVVKSDTGLGNDYKVLVTTDLELAVRDAGYRSVVEQLGQLKALLDQFRGVRGADGFRPALGPVTSIAVVAAQLLPGLLSLVSAKRSITTSEATVDDDHALMAVAGVLAGADRGGMVVADKARLLDGDGPAQQRWKELQAACVDLAADLTVEQEKEKPDAEWVAEAESLLKTCQSALSAMTTPRPDSKLSPLAEADLQEVLHTDRFQGVLIVKGGASSSTQLVDDRPLRFGDPLSVVTTATISYLLIDHRNDSRVIAGGLAHGVAQMHGKIGAELSVPN